MKQTQKILFAIAFMCICAINAQSQNEWSINIPCQLYSTKTNQFVANANIRVKAAKASTYYISLIVSPWPGSEYDGGIVFLKGKGSKKTNVWNTNKSENWCTIIYTANNLDTCLQLALYNDLQEIYIYQKDENGNIIYKDYYMKVSYKNGFDILDFFGDSNILKDMHIFPIGDTPTIRIAANSRDDVLGVVGRQKRAVASNGNNNRGNNTSGNTNRQNNQNVNTNNKVITFNYTDNSSEVKSSVTFDFRGQYVKLTVKEGNQIVINNIELYQVKFYGSNNYMATMLLFPAKAVRNVSSDICKLSFEELGNKGSSCGITMVNAITFEPIALWEYAYSSDSSQLSTIKALYQQFKQFKGDTGIDIEIVK